MTKYTQVTGKNADYQVSVKDGFSLSADMKTDLY